MASSNQSSPPEGQKGGRKRFVSGASCPKCGAEDKTYIIGEGLDMRRCCNQCGFEERLGDVADPGESVVQIKLPD